MACKSLKIGLLPSTIFKGSFFPALIWRCKPASNWAILLGVYSLPSDLRSSVTNTQSHLQTSSPSSLRRTLILWLLVSLTHPVFKSSNCPSRGLVCISWSDRLLRTLDFSNICKLKLLFSCCMASFLLSCKTQLSLIAPSSQEDHSFPPSIQPSPIDLTLDATS